MKSSLLLTAFFYASLATSARSEAPAKTQAAETPQSELARLRKKEADELRNQQVLLARSLSEIAQEVKLRPEFSPEVIRWVVNANHYAREKDPAYATFAAEIKVLYDRIPAEKRRAAEAALEARDKWITNDATLAALEMFTRAGEPLTASDLKFLDTLETAAKSNDPAALGLSARITALRKINSEIP